MTVSLRALTLRIFRRQDEFELNTVINPPRVAVYRWLPFGVAIAVWAIAFLPTISSIAVQWLENGAYSHGFLSLALALWAGWTQRQWIEPRPGWRWGAIALALAAGLTWWLADLAHVLKIQQLAVYGILCLIFVILCGWRVVPHLLSASLILFLVVPVWDFLQRPLQDWSTDVSFAVIRMLGVASIREGHLITMPGGRFLVEEACSGLGFLLCSLALAVFYIQLNHLRYTRAAILLLLAAAIAVLANWTRISTILIVGNTAGMQHPIVTDHLLFGWVVFSIALVPLFYISHRWFPAESPRTVPHAGGGESIESVESVRFGAVYAMPLAATIVLTILFPVLSRLAPGDAHSATDIATPSLPDTLPGGIEKIGARPWPVSFSGADVVDFATYETGGRHVDALLVHYVAQSQDSELINVNNHFVPPEWQELNERRDRIDDMGIAVKSLQYGLRRRTMFFWYVVAGEPTNNPVIAKFYEALGSMTGDRSASMFVVYADTNAEGASRDVVSALYTLSRR